MEIILNLLWLLVTAVIAGIWLAQSRDQHRWLGPGLQVLALVCAAILLFPVISATDDLQASVLAAETTDGKQHLKKFNKSGSSPSAIDHPAIDPVLRSNIFRVIDSGVIVDSKSGSDPSPTSFPGPLENRPPPSRSI